MFNYPFFSIQILPMILDHLVLGISLRKLPPRFPPYQLRADQVEIAMRGCQIQVKPLAQAEQRVPRRIVVVGRIHPRKAGQLRK